MRNQLLAILICSLASFGCATQPYDTEPATAPQSTTSGSYGSTGTTSTAQHASMHAGGSTDNSRTALSKAMRDCGPIT